MYGDPQAAHLPKQASVGWPTDELWKVWDFFDSIDPKQTSAPGWQVGKVSKRGQRVPTGCDPLAAETSQGLPLGASPDGPFARPPSHRGCLVHSSVVRFES